MLDLLLDATVRVGVVIFQSLPEGMVRRMGRFLGGVVYQFHKQNGVAYVNLKVAFPSRSPRELKRIARQSYENMGETAVEILRLPRLTPGDVKARIKVIDYEYVTEGLSEGKGLILLSAHMGNWELLAVLSNVLGHPTQMLIREPSSARLNRFLNELRRFHGTKVLERGSSGKSLFQALRGGCVVATAGDQSGGKEGTRVRFFGRLTTAPSGILAVAERVGSPVLPVFDVRERGAFHTCYVLPRLEPPRTGERERDLQVKFQEFVRILEGFIEKRPDQWLWGHKRWKYCFTKTIVFLTDEKKGHEVQLKAISRVWDEIGANEPRGFEIKKVSIGVHYRSRLHRFLLMVLAPLCRSWIQGRLGLLRWFLTQQSAEALKNQYADIVVSCGSGLLPVNWLLSRENRAKSVLLMKPCFPYNRLHFDLVIAPQHDAPIHMKEVVYTDLTPNLVQEQTVLEAGKRLRADLELNGTRTVAVFIGGDTKNYYLDGERLVEALDQVVQVVQGFKGYLLVTTSRRTPERISELVKNRLKGERSCRLLVIANEKNIEGITEAMMGCSEILIVTEDSIGMISEAVSSGKKVCVLELAHNGLSRKHRRFREHLEKKKFARVVAASELRKNLTELLQDRQWSRGSSGMGETVQDKLARLL